MLLLVKKLVEYATSSTSAVKSELVRYDVLDKYSILHMFYKFPDLLSIYRIPWGQNGVSSGSLKYDVLRYPLSNPNQEHTYNDTH